MDIIRTSKDKNELYRKANKQLNKIITEFREIIKKRNIPEEEKTIVFEYISKEVRNYFNNLKYIGKRYLKDKKFKINIVNIDKKITGWKNEIYMFMKAFMPGEKQINLIDWQINFAKKKSVQAGVLFRAVFDFYIPELNKLQNKLKDKSPEKQVKIFNQVKAELPFYLQKENKIKYLYNQISKLIFRNIIPFIEVLINFYNVEGINVDVSVSEDEENFIKSFPLNGVTLFTAIERTIDIFYQDIERNMLEGTSVNISYSKRQSAISKIMEDYLFAVFQYVHEKFVVEFKL